MLLAVRLKCMLAAGSAQDQGNGSRESLLSLLGNCLFATFLLPEYFSLHYTLGCLHRDRNLMTKCNTIL